MNWMPQKYFGYDARPMTLSLIRVLPSNEIFVGRYNPLEPTPADAAVMLRKFIRQMEEKPYRDASVVMDAKGFQSLIVRFIPERFTFRRKAKCVLIDSHERIDSM